MMNDSQLWLGKPTPCALCGEMVKFGDRYSTTDEPALCHESCAMEHQDEEAHGISGDEIDRVYDSMRDEEILGRCR